METGDQQFQLPSPTHSLSSFHPQVWIKRDDLIHPFVSGNKLRKIHYHAKEASQMGLHELVSYGGYYSNHLLALAAYGAQNNFKTNGMVKGEKPKKINAVLKLCDLFGMELTFLKRQDFLKQKTNYGKVGHLYHIPEGGATDLGMLGCQGIIEELSTEFEHIVLPVGTGTTLAGILSAMEKKKWEGKVHGVCVVNEKEEIKTFVRKYSKKNFQFYHYNSFGKLKNQEVEIVKEVMQKEGILLDPIYGVKAMHFLKKSLEEGNFEKRQKILFVHTGGKTGWLSEKMSQHLLNA